MAASFFLPNFDRIVLKDAELPEDQHNDRDDKDERDRSRDKDRKVAIGCLEGSPEVGIHERTKDDAEDEGRRRVFAFSEEDAQDDPEKKTSTMSM